MPSFLTHIRQIKNLAARFPTKQDWNAYTIAMINHYAPRLQEDDETEADTRSRLILIAQRELPFPLSF